MKTKTLFTTLFLCFFSVFAFAQESKKVSDLFDKLSESNEVQSVVITKALLQLMPESAAGIKGIDMGNLVKKIDHFGIYETGDVKAIEIMRSIAKEIEKDKSFEVLMKIKENDEQSSFFAEKGKDGIVKSFIMFMNESKETTIIRILGNFTSEDMKYILENINM